MNTLTLLYVIVFGFGTRNVVWSFVLVHWYMDETGSQGGHIRSTEVVR